MKVQVRQGMDRVRSFLFPGMELTKTGHRHTLDASGALHRGHPSEGDGRQPESRRRGSAQT